MPYSTATSTIIIASISLLVIAITSFFLIQHYSEVLQAFFPAGEKIWYGPPGNRREQITKHGSTDYFVISLVYDLLTEQNLVINSAICMVAGACSLAAIWVKRTKSSFWKIAPTATAIIALIASIASIIHVNVRRTLLHRSWCSERNGKGVRSAFRVTCTRELAACDLLVTGYLTDHDYANNKRLCTEARVSRALLIPFVVFSALLVSVYGYRWWRLRSGYTAVAESEDLSENDLEAPEEVEKTSTESS